MDHSAEFGYLGKLLGLSHMSPLASPLQGNWLVFFVQ
jgi:hypothetical protein